MDSENQVPTYSTGAPREKKFGPIIAALVIILLLIIAALYLFASKSTEEAVPAATEEGLVQQVMSTSTETSALEQDLNQATEGLENL